MGLTRREDYSQQRPCDHRIAEDGGDDAYAQRDGEAAYRAASEVEEYRRGDERSNVRVQDYDKRLAEAGVKGRHHRLAGAELFFHSFVYKNIAVHRHTYRKDHTSDAGKRKRRFKHNERGYDE